ncbi:MAG: 1-acyl-sn-glycerol-3-phosphate acyltransferase [Gemmatimonadaceae bacterium]
MTARPTVAASISTNQSIAPEIPPQVPRRMSESGRSFGCTGLRVLGWRMEGNLPDEAKLVLIVAPHTSNWDFVVGFLCYLALDVGATWFGKHTIFRWPFGAVFRHFGGIPIYRDSQSAGSVVDLYSDEFAKRERMVLAIAPEGTRRKVTEWKSGFYRIAVRAGASIVPVILDYSRKRIVLDAPIYPTGEWETDIVRIKGRFKAEQARHPEQF